RKTPTTRSRGARGIDESSSSRSADAQTACPSTRERSYASNLSMDSLLRDFRHAIRNLLRTPVFALITVFTLALGIGANTAIFSVVNAVILRPLGYPRPERLVYISSQFPALGFDQFWISPPEFVEL